MSASIDRYLLRAAWGSLFALAFVGFVIYPNILYPDVFTKGLFVRFVITVAAVCFVWLLLRGKLRFPKMTPLARAVLAYAVVLLVSMLASGSVYRSFWGEAQRMEGVFGLLHYVALFFIARALFEKKDWLSYFKLVIAGTPFLIFYAILQYVGSRWGVRLPFVYSLSTQPGSLFGNPAFFSMFLLFASGFAGFVYYLEKNAAWKRFALFVAALSLCAIFWIGVRGAAIGAFVSIALFACFVAFSRGERKRKKTARIFLAGVGCVAAAMLLLSPYLSGYYPNLIQKIINLPNEASFATRLLSLQSSLKAWTDSPKTFLVGWGPEQFSVGYNKYYNPKHGTYEDAWFDRAHNKIADVFVMTGLLGLISYLFLFIAAAIYVWRLRLLDEYRPLAFVAGALLLGYFAQNLTFFDLPQTYVNFFLLIAFLEVVTRQGGGTAALQKEKTFSFARASVGTLVTAGAVLLLAYTVVVPIVQSSRYVYYFRTHKGNELMNNLDSIFRPRNFTHYALLDDFWRQLESQNSFRDPQYNPITDYLVREMEYVVGLEPFDASMFLRLSTVYTEKGIGAGDIVALKTGEEYARKAISLSPGRQEDYYMLAFSLQGQKRAGEAVQVMRDAVALNPETMKARYNLGLNVALAGNLEEAVKEIETVRLAGWFQTFQEKDARNIISIYIAAKQHALLQELYKDFLKNKILKDKEYFIVVLKDAITREDREAVVLWTGRYRGAYPEYGNDMDFVLGLLEKGRWDLLKKL